MTATTEQPTRWVVMQYNPMLCQQEITCENCGERIATLTDEAAVRAEAPLTLAGALQHVCIYRPRGVTA